MIKTFKVISFLEGLSYILLLFIGVPLKYALGNDVLVKLLGMPHGVLFIAYLVLCILVRPKLGWTNKVFFIAGIMSVIPFGTFYVNKRYV